jgi:hypothetical protein
MAEWSEDHVAAISSLKTQLWFLVSVLWLKWRLGGAPRWKGKTIGWEGQRVVHGKPTPSRL